MGAIYARAILIVWPFRRFGVPEYNKSHAPPGPPLRREPLDLLSKGSRASAAWSITRHQRLCAGG